MAAATLDHFPPDTKVEVWTKTGDSFDGGGRGKRVGREVQVGTDGSLVLTGLKDDREYWAVGDTGRVVNFVAVDPDPRSGKRASKKSRKASKVKPRGRAAQTSAGRGKRASSTPGPEKARRASGGAKAISATQQGGSGRSTTAHDEKLTGRPGKATQQPQKRTGGTKKGAKGVRGARSSRSR